MGYATRGRCVAAASVACAALTLGAGCSGDSNKKVGVTLQEYKVNVKTGSAKAGKVEFEVENVGSTIHEFVVVRAKDAASLKTKPDGSFNEDTLPAADQIGELENLHVKAKEPVTFSLKAGDYVLFCNIVQTDVKPSIQHFAKGMHAQFTVTD